METNAAEYWCDVVLTEGDEKIITYRTGMVVYEESLTQGRFLTRGWNGSGYISFAGGRLDSAGFALPQGFRVEMDGQYLGGDWNWQSFEQFPDDQPIPAMRRPYRIHTVATLAHSVRPVTVKVHTGLDGTAVITRWLEITNTGDRPAALASAASWSGVLQQTPNWYAHLLEGRDLYSLGHFESPAWAQEGDFRWTDLPQACFSLDARFRRAAHRHPFFVLRNNATGEHFVGQFAWSGGYRFEFDQDGGAITFAAGTDGPAPQRVLAPGETIATPEMHLGLTFGGLDEAINAMHAHIRRTVIMEQPRGRGCWVESGIGPEVGITVDQVNNAIDAAGDFGAEIFFIDASWYGKPKSEWWNTVGDWDFDRERFPDGPKPFKERANAKGMLWGLWMDAERVASKSRVVQEHPDWQAVDYSGHERLAGLLDLTNPDAARWMEEQITRVIAENELEFFRLDYNTNGLSRAQTRTGDYVESSYWRYYEAQYAIYDRLRARFPEVIFENCAGGGGRTDLGMVRRFSHTWVSDNQIAPRTFSIVNGMTMALPPEYVDRLIGGMNGHTTADFDFQSRLLLFGRPTIAFTKAPGTDWSQPMLARLRHMVDLYKNFVRPFLPESRIYHHTPAVPNSGSLGWGVLELASADRTRALCGLFQLAAPAAPEYLLRLRGLDIGRRYRVTFDNSGQTCEMEGVTLMQQGITLRREGALTSELLVIEAI